MLHAGTNLDVIDHAAFDEVLKRPGQMLRTDAVHRGAKTAMVIKADDALTLICVAAREAIDEVNLSADREGGP